MPRAFQGSTEWRHDQRLEAAAHDGYHGIRRFAPGVGYGLVLNERLNPSNGQERAVGQSCADKVNMLDVSGVLRGV